MSNSESSAAVLFGGAEQALKEVSTSLQMLPCPVETACHGDQVLRRVMSHPDSLRAVFLDFLLPPRDALITLKQIRRIAPELPVLIISGPCSTVDVVLAMKYGATDFLFKPVSAAAIRNAVACAYAGTAPGQDERASHSGRAAPDPGCIPPYPEMSAWDPPGAVVGIAERLLCENAIPGRPVPHLTPDLCDALMRHPWGNIRELETIVRKIAILGDGAFSGRNLPEQPMRKGAAPQTRRAACH